MIQLALGAEFIGICHFSWLLYYSASRLVCRRVRKMQRRIDNESAEMIEDPMSPTEKIRGPNFDGGMKKADDFTWFDYPRFLWSTAATLGAVCVVCYGISKGVYVLPVPPIAAFIVAFTALTCLFYLEGLMIASKCEKLSVRVCE